MLRSQHAPQRRLWETQHSQEQTSPPETYDEIFQRFAAKPPVQSLFWHVENTIVVGQEFFIVCLILARHKGILKEEENMGMISEEDLIRINFSLGFLFSAFCLVIGYGERRSSRAKFRQRATDASLLAILLRIVASVLRTLTASYSSDTVLALSIFFMIVHLLLCDYNYANGYRNASHKPVHPVRHRPAFQGGILSLNAAFLATILLASRMDENTSVYFFICSSVVVFAFYPESRHHAAHHSRQGNRWVPFVATALFGAAMVSIMTWVESVVAVSIFMFLCLIVPSWKYYLQRHKTTLRGPWDIADLNDSR